MDAKINEQDYKNKFERYASHVAKTHEKNQKKIKTCIKINLILPWIFLLISYCTDRSKLVFLILWIVSLFGTAFYLVYIEYSDYRMEQLFSEFEGEKDA